MKRILIGLSEKEYHLFQNIIRNKIQCLYDDNSGFDSIQELRERLNFYKMLCQKLDLNFDQVVIEESTECERKDIQKELDGKGYLK